MPAYNLSPFFASKAALNTADMRGINFIRSRYHGVRSHIRQNLPDLVTSKSAACMWSFNRTILLPKMSPCFAFLYVGDCSLCNSVVCRDFSKFARIVQYLNYLDFREFCQRVFSTKSLGAMHFLVGMISFARIIPKICKSIVNTYSVIVTYLHRI